MKIQQSETFFHEAKHVIPGGVNSPVRAFKGVGGNPIFIRSASGASLTSVDNKQYIDFVGSWGPMILGHSHPSILQRVMTAVQSGLSFGAPTPGETSLAELICERVPSIEQVRLVSSGTEAVMSALRLARAATGREKIIKFVGCYHGHCDSMLVEAGSGAMTLGAPSSPGVTQSVAQDTLLADFNDLDSVERLFEAHPDSIASIIIEPIAGNMGVVLPQPGFLPGLRDLCDHYGALLIFDEVMTGFRVAPGGAQALFEVTPDLTTLGKVIGGGLPVGAFGGRRDLMSLLAPVGAVYQAGTLSGNPVAMAAGIATLELLSDESIYHRLAEKTARLQALIQQAALNTGTPVVVNAVCGMLSVFYTNSGRVHSYRDVKQCDTKAYAALFHHLLEQGVYFAPSAYESLFLSDAHSSADLDVVADTLLKFWSTKR